jgi:hypothetical protein
MPGHSRPRLVVLALLAASGCGGGGASIPLADLGARLLDAICTREVRCGVYPDKATCEAEAGDLLDEGQLIADVNAGRSVYDGKAAADCLSTYDSPTGFGSCSNSVALSAHGPSSCGDAIKGTLATGAACIDNDVCLSGNCDRSACTSGVACCMGVCVAAKTTVAIGDDCSSAMVTCPDGSFCQTSTTATGTTRTCVAKIAAGQPCAALTDCAPGTVCVSDAASGAGVCGTWPTRGQSCMASQFCDDVTDYCNTTTGLCTARAIPGGACPQMNACVAYATCTTTTATCVAQGQVGAVCVAPADCLSGNCAAGTCAVQPAPVVCP